MLKLTVGLKGNRPVECSTFDAAARAFRKIAPVAGDKAIQLCINGAGGISLTGYEAEVVTGSWLESNAWGYGDAYDDAKDGK